MLKNGSQSEFRRYAHRVNFVFAIRDWLYHVSVMTPRYHLLSSELSVVQAARFSPDPGMRLAAEQREAEVFEEISREVMAARPREALPLAAEGTGRAPVEVGHE